MDKVDFKLKKSTLELEKENFVIATQKPVERKEKHLMEWGASLDQIGFVKRKSRLEIEKEAFLAASKMCKK